MHDENPTKPRYSVRESNFPIIVAGENQTFFVHDRLNPLRPSTNWEWFTTKAAAERRAEILNAAHAHLCDTAPDLLAALRAVKALALPGATHIHRVCDDAIAKAEGKPHAP